MHLGLSSDGTHKPIHFFGQAMYVEDIFRKEKAKKVLEVGCGKGFNLLFLAGRNPNIQFKGVDLMELHVKIANAKVKKLGLKNVCFVQGNFTELNDETEHEYDFAYSVECFCYCSTPEQRKAYFDCLNKVLKPHKKMVIVDFSRPNNFKELPFEARAAAKLSELGVFLKRCSYEQELKDAAKQHFDIIKDSECRQAVMPSTIRLWRFARAHFNLCTWFHLIMRPTLIKWLEKNNLYNTVVVLALAHAFGQRSLLYNIIEFQKKS